MKIILLLLLCGVASAQETLTYSDGDSIFTTSLVLSQALPQNGTVDVSPTAVNFGGSLVGFTSPYGFIFEPGFVPVYSGTAAQVSPVYQFTMTNGQITAFDIALNLTTPGNSPTNLTLILSSAGDSYFEQLTGFQCEDQSCNPIIAASAPGTWDPPTKAPEFNISMAITGITLLFGCVAVLKGRNARAI